MTDGILDKYIDSPGRSDLAELDMIYPPNLQNMPIPERKWMIEGLIPWGHTTALYGDGGTGKSLLAMQMMTALALGKPFLGHKTEPVKVMGFFCEDDQNELHIRQANINRHYDCDFADLEHVGWLDRTAEDNMFMTFEDTGLGAITELFERFEQTILKFGAQFVVIDTAADTFGGNENSRLQVRQYVGTCLNRLAKKIDGSVLLCAHPSISGMTSGRGDGGNTGWNNTVRARLYFEFFKKSSDSDEEDWDRRVLSKKKLNYGRLDDGMDLIYRNGVFIPYSSMSGGFVEQLDKKNKERHVENCFLKGMDAIDAQGRNLSSSRNSGNYAPTLLMSNSHCAGLKKSELINAMNRLFDQKKIKDEPYGRGKNPSKKIVRIVNEKSTSCL
ncbi:MAG: AAA family ATPase [Alphaproteobacteria bacterium]|nr:AAA family ATPase [Alphaproteobacteria bacterium]